MAERQKSGTMSTAHQQHAEQPTNGCLHFSGSPPTPEEISSHRAAMEWTDKALRKSPRDYSDAAVIRSLIEPMPDSGGTVLGEARALTQLLAVSHLFEENDNSPTKK